MTAFCRIAQEEGDFGGDGSFTDQRLLHSTTEPGRSPCNLSLFLPLSYGTKLSPSRQVHFLHLFSPPRMSHCPQESAPLPHGSATTYRKRLRAARRGFSTLFCSVCIRFNDFLLLFSLHTEFLLSPHSK